jgi:Ni/Co efflux regulator RcnB
MNRLLVATALAVALMSGAVTVQADGRDQRHERRDDHRRHDRNNDRHEHDRRDFRQNRSHDWSRHDHRDGGRRYHYGRYIAPRGYYHRSWRHGDHLPSAYYAPRYIVHDYHSYRLRPPPRGYYWVRVDNDVLLASIASGLVVSAVYDLFY